MDTQKGQNPLKHRLSTMFRTSLGSCKSKSISADAISPTNRKHFQLYQLFSPKSTFITSTTHNKPKKHSENHNSENQNKPKKHSENTPQAAQPFPPRPKVSDRNSLLDSAFSKPSSKKKRNNNKKKRSVHGLKRSDFESFDNYYDWFSSDDENDDKTTLFSSKSLSSDSSDSFRRKKEAYRRKRASKRDRSEAKEVKEGCFVVEKKSSDPYDDFTTSMVEMIVEKQIFGARDLEDLLETFLSLNSRHHHTVIVEVFNEICDALFSNWS